jgi:hypothetical protein
MHKQSSPTLCSIHSQVLVAAEYAIGIPRKKNNNIELIALHVIHSEIKYAYSTYYGGSVNQSSIERIIEHAKREAQTWFDKVQENGSSRVEPRLTTHI